MCHLKNLDDAAFLEFSTQKGGLKGVGNVLFLGLGSDNRGIFNL